MRIAGLLALAILFPAFVYASALSLTTYTLSSDVVYPGMSTTIDVAFSEKVIASIKIVSSGGTEIPFYSSSGVTNPNPKVWDGTNAGMPVSAGVYTILIAATSFNDPSLTLTDSSKTITVVSSGTPPDIASSTIESVTPTSGAASTYIPPPSAISVEAGPNVTAHLEVPLTLTASAKTKNGAIDPSAIIHWSFGDGSSAEGTVVEKVYRYIGTYLVVITAKDGLVFAQDDMVVTVKPAMARIAAITGEGITLANDTNERLDLSGWRLIADTGSFRLPEGTMLLPNANVLFPYSVINLPVSFDVALAYPDGVIATRYVPTAPVPTVPVQLSASAESYESVQAVRLDEVPARQVEPIISMKQNIQAHDEAVGAPAAEKDLAAAGAALPDSPAKPAASGIFHSPWTLGFLGVMALAGGAFILL